MLITAELGTTFDYFSMEEVRCYVEKETNSMWSASNPVGTCDCVPGKVLDTNGKCQELVCIATASGEGCKICADPLTRNNECTSCHPGYVLSTNGDCVQADEAVGFSSVVQENMRSFSRIIIFGLLIIVGGGIYALCGRHKSTISPYTGLLENEI